MFVDIKCKDFKSLDDLTGKTELFLMLNVHNVKNITIMFISSHNLRKRGKKGGFKINNFKSFLVIKEANVSQLSHGFSEEEKGAIAIIIY